jgi:superfamily II DNA or RNA helicase
MGRRFPPPIFGLKADSERYRTVVQTAFENESPPERSDFVAECQGKITKPDSGEQYTESYIKRIVGAYVQIGALSRDNSGDQTILRPSPFAEELLDGTLPLSECVWKSLKRRWVAMGNRPEGVEGLNCVLRTVADAADSLNKNEIQRRLSDDDGYEFNEAGLRGYPELLQLLGALELTDDGLETTSEDVVDRYKRRFRDSDIFRTLEARLRREGAMVEPPDNSAKQDLAKYYMYRESGGWQKRRQWYETFWQDYLKPETRSGNTGSELRRQEKYRDFSSKRHSLRERIRSRFESFQGDSLSGLSASLLERIADADTKTEARRLRVAAGSGISRADLRLLEDDSRAEFTFPESFELYDWQADASAAWFAGDGERQAERGIAQVVTGAGKTIMALDVLRQWLNDDSDRVATVVVPTKVLMQQWLVELVSTLNIPVDEVGWAGGGHKDDFDDCRVLVSIVNSAVQNDYLGDILDEAGRPEHFLIADECHRYTGDKFSNIFDYPRSAALGLSATAVSRGDNERTDDDELLLSELGDIYYELTYDEGIRRGLIPEFSIKYIGFDLAPRERTKYERLSENVSAAVKDIQQRFEHRLYELPGGFAQKLQTIRNEVDGPTPAITDYFEYTQDRRDLVDNAAARQAITLRLLRDAVENNDKTIIFQERIEQLEQLIAPLEQRGVNPRTGELSADADNYRTQLYEEFEGLKDVDEQMEALFADPDYWPVMYHSGHSRDVWNDIAMEWFRQEDMANVMLSVKALVEGVDVPSADVGIVRVSSSSIRQRIQTLGRILRTGDDPDERSTLYVLYARDTIDERIFKEYDWENELASAHVEQKSWESDPDEGYAAGRIRDATPEEYPPRPEPETIPDGTELEMGDQYDGSREPVRTVSVSSDGQLFEKQGVERKYIDATGFQETIDFVLRKKGGGTLIINEHDHLITVLQDGPVFLRTVDGPEAFEPAEAEHPDDTEDSGEESLIDDPDEFSELF